MSAPGIIGIDIGVLGAMALVTPAGEILEVSDMPVLKDGPAGRPTVNAALLADLLRIWRPARAYVEFVGVWPTDGRQGAFAFGRARGCVEGTLGALVIPTRWLTVPTWRRAVGLPGNASKDAARSEAIRRWPAQAGLFARARDDGRAEACLIAVAGMLREAAR